MGRLAAGFLGLLLGTSGSWLPAMELCIEGRWPFGPARAVAVDAGLEVTTSGAVMLVVDVADPTAPQVVGQIDLSATIWDLALADGCAFAASGGAIHLIDVSTPSAPREVATIAGDSLIAAAGGWLYVATLDARLRVFDVSEPSAPVELGSLALDEAAYAISLDGALVYYVTSLGLYVVDATDPAAPVELGSYTSQYGFDDVAVSGPLAIAAFTEAFARTGIAIFDVSSPAAPLPLGSYITSTSLPSPRVALAGSLAVVVGNVGGGLLVLDLKTPSSPTVVGQLGIPARPQDIVLAGPYAFFAAGSAGAGIASVSADKPPILVGWIGDAAAGAGEGVAVSTGFTFLADSFHGLWVLDVSDPSHPVRRGVAATPLSSHAVAVAGGFALVSGNGAVEGELSVVDVTIPNAPTVVGSLALPRNTLGVAISGTLASVASWDKQVYLVDISDPSLPVEVGAFPTAGVPRAVAASSGLLFVADDDWPDGGLRIVDASNPAAPVEIAFAPTGGTATGVALNGSIALVAARYDGLRLYDVTDPAAPVEIGSVPATDSVDRVATSGRWAFVVDGSLTHRLRMIDISDPSAPLEVATLDLPEPSNDVAADGETAYLAMATGGLLVVSPCPLFADAFESGDTGAWSGSVP